MAKLSLICPEKTYVGTMTRIYAQIIESYPFEFSLCGEGMKLEVFGKEIDVAPYFPAFGDVVEVPIEFKPSKEGTINVRVKLKGHGFLCRDVSEAECKISVEKSIVPVPYVDPKGIAGRLGEMLPWIVGGLIGLALVTALVRR